MAKKESDEDIVLEAQERFRLCQDYESYARANYEIDVKFANGDSINNYQWLDDIRQSRIGDPAGARPCLTINKTKVHNLAIINDAKQNKTAINIRPIGDGATYEASQIYNDIVRHIEYRSNAQTVYDHASTTQVEGGIGYWRVIYDYEDDDSFNQELRLIKINDPRSVYIDKDIKEADGSDARYGFVFEDEPKDLFDKNHPDDKDVGGPAIMGSYDAGWYNRNTVRVCEYFRKKEKKDRLVAYEVQGQQIKERWSKLDAGTKSALKLLLDNEDPSIKIRDIIVNDIEWFKIAGNTIIDRKPWIGNYIPLIRVVGTEIVLDGQMDRYGNTRALLDPQRMYNYNSSNYVEMVALQPRAPFIASAESIEGHEDDFANANTRNHSVLTFNAYTEDGKELQPPRREAPPQIVPAYVSGMQIAENQMMMASGQYQAQMGENENAKSGVAINARQRQGDRATYHFIDNLAVAIRFTGKVLLDLIPKIYDTQRILLIQGLDNSISQVTIDPNADGAIQKQQGQQEEDNGRKVAQVIFNPNVGKYDVISDVGPSYATRRQEAVANMIELTHADPEIIKIGGDLIVGMMDFPEAQALSQRLARTIPPNIKGEGPDPQTEQAMHMASDKIQQLMAENQKLQQEIEDKTKEFNIKAYDAESVRMRAESDQLKQLDNARTSLDGPQLETLLRKVMADMFKPNDAAEVEGNVGIGNIESAQSEQPEMANG